jgi:hypothetical protein
MVAALSQCRPDARRSELTDLPQPSPSVDRETARKIGKNDIIPASTNENYC